MRTKDDLLKKYDGPNQDTKRAIIQHLWRYPDSEHEPEKVFRAVKDDCRAKEVSTVRNNLSDLVAEEPIRQESRSFYQWDGQGRPRPNSRLREVGDSFQRWMTTLDLSYGTILFAFMIWIAGILSGIVSLIALFAPQDSILGIPFLQWFIIAGTMTLLGSAVVMIWVPMYLLDIKLAK